MIALAPYLTLRKAMTTYSFSLIISSADTPYCTLSPSPTSPPKALHTILVEEYVLKLGVPKRFLSDNDKTFRSELPDASYKRSLCKIDTSYHPTVTVGPSALTIRSCNFFIQR